MPPDVFHIICPRDGNSFCWADVVLGDDRRAKLIFDAGLPEEQNLTLTRIQTEGLARWLYDCLYPLERGAHNALWRAQA